MSDKEFDEIVRRAEREKFQTRIRQIEANQHTIYGKLTSSVTGIEEEHRKMLVELLGDYKALFERKISMVDRHDNELKRLTSQLKQRIISYNQHTKTLRKAVREADTIRIFFNVQVKKLNDEILRYNELASQLNAKLLELREGGD